MCQEMLNQIIGQDLLTHVINQCFSSIFQDIDDSTCSTTSLKHH